MNRTKFTFSIFLFSAFSILNFSGCETTVGPDSPDSVPLGGLAINDAQALFVEVREASLSSGTNSISADIRKLVSGGRVLNVPYTSDSGDTLSTESLPVDMFRAGENHFSVGFLVETYQGYSPNLSALIDINTGEAYTFNNLYPSRQTYFLNAGTIQTDAEGSIYMMNFFQEGGRQYVYKIDLNAAEINARRVTPNELDTGWWFVDARGNLAIAAPDPVISGTEIPYFIKSSGDAIQMPSINFWVSAMGDIYNDAYSSADSSYDILTISSMDDSISADTVLSDMEVPILYRTGEKLLLRADGRTMIILKSENAGHRAYDVTDGEIPEEISGITSQFSDYETATSSNKFHYVYGEGTGGSPLLLKIDPNGYTTSVVTTEYEIVRMSASPTTDEILFTGNRAGDENVYMVGHIDAANSVTVLADSMAIASPGLIYLK